jgi:hypothetical protein
LKKLGEGEVVFMRHRLRILKELLCKKIGNGYCTELRDEFSFIYLNVSL